MTDYDLHVSLRNITKFKEDTHYRVLIKNQYHIFPFVFFSINFYSGMVYISPISYTFKNMYLKITKIYQFFRIFLDLLAFTSHFIKNARATFDSQYIFFFIQLSFYECVHDKSLRNKKCIVNKKHMYSHTRIRCIRDNYDVVR